MPGQSGQDSSPVVIKDRSLKMHFRTPQTLFLRKAGAGLTELVLFELSIVPGNKMELNLPSLVASVKPRMICLGRSQSFPKSHQPRPDLKPRFRKYTYFLFIENISKGAYNAPSPGLGFRGSDLLHLVCHGSNSSPEYFSMNVCFTRCARVFFQGSKTVFH